MCFWVNGRLKLCIAFGRDGIEESGVGTRLLFRFFLIFLFQLLPRLFDHASSSFQGHILLDHFHYRNLTYTGLGTTLLGRRTCSGSWRAPDPTVFFFFFCIQFLAAGIGTGKFHGTRYHSSVSRFGTGPGFVEKRISHMQLFLSPRRNGTSFVNPSRFYASTLLEHPKICIGAMTEMA